MSSLKPASSTPTALLLVDIQSGLTTDTTYFGHTRSNPALETNVSSLLSHTRSYNTSHPDSNKRVLIVHVNHNSTSPNSPLHSSKPTNAPFPYAAPIDGEAIFHKSTHSAFGNPDLKRYLVKHNIKQLLVCGISSAHCVSTTVRAASDDKANILGGDGTIALIEDASAAFNTADWDADTVHKVNVSVLKGEFCEVLGTEEVVGTVLS